MKVPGMVPPGVVPEGAGFLSPAMLGPPMAGPHRHERGLVAADDAGIRTARRTGYW
jgi:hypothetical protein